MYNIKFFVLIFISILPGFLACGNTLEPEEEAEVSEENEIVLVGNSDNHDEPGDYSWDSSEEIQIVLNANTVTVNGSGARAEGSKVTVTSAGTYNLTGILDDGQIIVNTDDEEIVRLILNGVHISNSTNAPIYIASAAKAMIVLANNTENIVTDGTSYVFENTEEDEPNAAIFSKADLTIYGNGSLTVEGNYNDGIASKDGLIITSGTINVNSVDDGIRGKDYLIVKDGTIIVEASGDGLKSDNVDDASKGYITIENGSINITAGGDAIDAEKGVAINLGELVLSSGGKGINAAISTIIDGGTFTINSADDAIHSNGLLTINDGSFVISSDDDGLHADYDLVINDGDIHITKSYEGIESAEGDITINGGEIHLVSSDDGLNLAAGGTSGMGGPGQRASTSSGNYYLYINGGYIVINANGDGVDANASIVMTDGDVIVSGSTASSNSALDYDGSFAMNGGFLVAAGTSRMAEAPGTSSNQNSILVSFSSTQKAGSLIHIENQNGQEILTFSPVKSYQSVAFSSPELTTGSTFNVYLGGRSSGTAIDGLYKDGTYTQGSKYKSFTISSTVTIVN